MALEWPKESNTKRKREFIKHPLRNQSYGDPLRKKYVDYKVQPIDLKNRIEIPKYQVYILPNIDPLRNKPRIHRPHQEPAQKKVHDEPKKMPQYFPKQLGSSVGSVKRAFSIHDNLNI